MIELGVFSALLFILVGVAASYLLKAELRKSGAPENSIEKAHLVAIGLPKITSVKASAILQGNSISSYAGLSRLGKTLIILVRAALILAVLSIGLGVFLRYLRMHNKALKALAMLAWTSASYACSGPSAQRYAS